MRAADAVTPEEAPVIVASQENVPALDAALGDRYTSEYYGLRPGVLLTVYIERTLWETVPRVAIEHVCWIHNARLNPDTTPSWLITRIRPSPASRLRTADLAGTQLVATSRFVSQSIILSAVERSPIPRRSGSS